jgi:hypothetical protein
MPRRRAARSGVTCDARVPLPALVHDAGPASHVRQLSGACLCLQCASGGCFRPLFAVTDNQDGSDDGYAPTEAVCSEFLGSVKARLFTVTRNLIVDWVRKPHSP